MEWEVECTKGNVQVKSPDGRNGKCWGKLSDRRERSIKFRSGIKCPPGMVPLTSAHPSFYGSSFLFFRSDPSDARASAMDPSRAFSSLGSSRALDRSCRSVETTIAAKNIFENMPTFYIFIIGFLFVALIIFGVYKVIAYRSRQQKMKERRKLKLLVERMRNMIYGSGAAGVADPQLRDMIMPASRCSEAAECKRWLEAARLINNEEPRIRTEKRLINGTECNVWIWRDAEVSPMARILDRALTRCLKLRGVKFTTLVDREFIRQDLMARLYPLVPKHVGFISGTENVVYMMLEDLDDAKSAFLAFHFHWFNGSLLSAKYLRDERYLERFPDAEE